MFLHRVCICLIPAQKFCQFPIFVSLYSFKRGVTSVTCNTAALPFNLTYPSHSRKRPHQNKKTAMASLCIHSARVAPLRVQWNAGQREKCWSSRLAYVVNTMKGWEIYQSHTLRLHLLTAPSSHHKCEGTEKLSSKGFWENKGYFLKNLKT